MRLAPLRPARGAATVATLAAAATLLTVHPVAATPPAALPGTLLAAPRWDCPPAARALGYSDALDKLSVGGAVVGGLSDLARDRRTRTWVSTVDNDETRPARLWAFRSLRHPRVVGAPVVLRRPDGSAYTGVTSDFEGLAVLPSGHFLVSSETEPSIRVFGRHGRQLSRLRVPARFRVAPAGQAADNAGLEGLTSTPSGRRVVAAMEGTLSGDVGRGDVDLYRRLLVYERHGGRFRLDRQVGYRVDTGMRIAEVAAYGEHRLLVLEAAYDPTVGNTVRLYAVTGLAHARDVSRVRDLSRRPRAVVGKRLVADLVACPSLGAPAEGLQTNPLLDNYEGLAVTPVSGRRHRVTLVSDDNFNAGQVTRVLRLAARLP